jgi:hypothetical protein
MRRKRKGPQEGKKFVRVDHKTIIEVDINKPDDVAIKEFLDKVSIDRPAYLYRRKKNGS